MPPVQHGLRQMRLLVTAFVILFFGLALLAFFFVTGESRRAQLLVEYDADRIASGLLDAFRAERALDPASIDPRVLGFGIYRASGDPLSRFGDAPPSLAAERGLSEFRFDQKRGTLTLLRPLGMMGLAPRGMMGGGGFMGMMQPGRRFLRPVVGPGGMLFLSMDIRSHYGARRLYGAAMVAAPILVAGLAGAFLFLLASNLRYRRRAEAQETLARLGESARTLAHEIRNPLSAIRIQTGLLRRALPAGRHRELDVIDEETERLNLLARRVGEFLKSPAGTPERIDVRSFLHELAAKLPHPVRLEPGPPAGTVSFDRELLRSVVENLVRNAYESYEGGEGPIEVSALREGARVVLSVSDRGKGIPAELSEKVFDPFFTDKVHGSGIGLSLSRRFVEAAGGTLTLSARSGGGTEARIVLPAGRDE